jgi:hypothetical protein
MTRQQHSDSGSDARAPLAQALRQGCLARAAQHDIEIGWQCLAAGAPGPQVELQYARSKESLRG